jgi:flagellar hook protein FlgE
MFSSFYSSLSGLINFSKGLNVLSNNISNMNTQGFKSSTASFRDLVYKNTQSLENQSSLQLGSGVSLGSTRLDFKQGEIQSTSNDLNVAVDGNGLFILQDGNEQFYTRAGNFQFDGDDFLVDATTGFKVLGIGSGGSLDPINISHLKINSPTSTTELTFENNLSTGSTTHTVPGLSVVDSLGTSYEWTLDFTNNTATTAGSWLFDVKDNNNANLSNGEIRFNPDGTLQTGFNKHTFSFAPSGSFASDVTLNFGEPNDSSSGVTSLSLGATSSMAFDDQNGIAAGAILSTTFDEGGDMTIGYSNAQSVTSHSLALAWFSNIQDLVQSGGALFKNLPKNPPIISKASEGLNGTISAGSIELSNVDLTEEFTDLIVVQRGFQGSSQIISATNELIQELLDLNKGR